MLCDLFSLYAHRVWKSHLSNKVANTPGVLFLDIAAGTGDIALRVASQLSKENRLNEKKIVLGDICHKMLSVARRKAVLKGITCEYRILDAHHLESIADNSVDILSISFAMKICDRDKVLTSAYRVLKPGGKFYCLEASRIPTRWLYAAYLLYMRLCVPVIAMIVTKGDRSAYNYLLKGIHEFPDINSFSEEVALCGFIDVNATPLSLGIVSLHEGIKAPCNT